MNIVVLTGAGISAESGISTFRDSNGLWENHDVRDVASPEGFKRDPELVHKFYNARRAQLKEVEPNAAHIALAKFESSFKGNFTLITQNVDDLHERAGSQNVLHMHGELRKVRCCNRRNSVKWFDDCSIDDRCTCCVEPSRLRPHIVWFGESPFYMMEISSALEACDLFVSIGTSGNVYPAASFAEEVTMNGKRTVCLNKERPSNGCMFNQIIIGNGTEIVPEFFNNLLKEQG